MNKQKVVAIKRAARKMNDGENPSKTDLRLLKKFNKSNTIANIKEGKLIFNANELNVPISAKIVKAFNNTLDYNGNSKTVGSLRIQRYGIKSFTQRISTRRKRRI